MPSISIAPSSNAVATATATGTITITNAVGVFAGAWGWLHKNDGSSAKKVKILSTSVSGTTTTCQLRVYPDLADEFGFGQAVTPGGGLPTYCSQDVSAFNTASSLDTWRQSIPVDPAFSTRDFRN